MSRAELPERSVSILTEYYKNNITPFLDAFSDACLWIGPARGQIIRTKKALTEAFSKGSNALTFGIQNLKVIPVPVNAGSLDVVMTFTVASYYPSGQTIMFQQRIELLWAEETVRRADRSAAREYRIRVCHISNEYPYDMRDTIYPNHFEELDIAKIYTGRMKSCKFSLRGLNSSYFYLSGDTILWMTSKGSHTAIHTVDGEYESVETLACVAEKYADTLVKVHASFAVNPLYVAEIGRFYVRMVDGMKISIPEKKYTRTRDEINRRISAANRT